MHCASGEERPATTAIKLTLAPPFPHRTPHIGEPTTHPASCLWSPPRPNPFCPNREWTSIEKFSGARTLFIVHIENDTSAGPLCESASNANTLALQGQTESRCTLFVVHMGALEKAQNGAIRSLATGQGRAQQERRSLFPSSEMMGNGTIRSSP